MKLKTLLEGINFECNFFKNLYIKDIVCNSKNVIEDCIFVCIQGQKSDGHNHYKDALDRGASYILTEKNLNIDNQIIVENTRFAYSKMCQNFFENPSKKIKLIGITGTNGKTTVANIIADILRNAGEKVGVIGTIQVEIGDKIIPCDKTTPDAYELQKMLKSMVTESCSYVIMEVSSHALDQNRIGDMIFEVGVFTNLTQDHLDYHIDMNEYFLAKRKLFKYCKIGIFNVDDKYGLSLFEDKEIKCIKKSYSILKNTNIDFFADNISNYITGSNFKINYTKIKKDVNFIIPGNYSVQNCLSALGTIINLDIGIEIDIIVESLNKFKGVRGRSEIIGMKNGVAIICDYAHTPDGLLNILPSIKEYTKGRIITIFGCGGDRDKLKRPLMAKAAAKYSDFLIITSDNPRTENPDEIINDIVSGIVDSDIKYITITDRRNAIKEGIIISKEGDIILLAGKGHEDYQVLNGKTIDFDEQIVVNEIFKELSL